MPEQLGFQRRLHGHRRRQPQQILLTHRNPPVGLRLLAIAVDQPTSLLNDTPLSRAGEGLQGIVVYQELRFAR
ncbi:hypothetical protein DMX02_10135 [Pseudomonas jessenii]|nr:hypothetical protein DMX02_10135 [Pseudomonas jessenii]